MTALLDQESIEFAQGEEMPSCNKADADATASVVQLCCGTSWLVCDQHLRRARARAESGRLVRCTSCGTVLRCSSMESVYRVVTL